MQALDGFVRWLTSGVDWLDAHPTGPMTAVAVSLTVGACILSYLALRHYAKSPPKTVRDRARFVAYITLPLFIAIVGGLIVFNATLKEDFKDLRPAEVLSIRLGIYGAVLVLIQGVIAVVQAIMIWNQIAIARDQVALGERQRDIARDQLTLGGEQKDIAREQLTLGQEQLAISARQVEIAEREITLVQNQGKIMEEQQRELQRRAKLYVYAEDEVEGVYAADYFTGGVSVNLMVYNAGTRSAKRATIQLMLAEGFAFHPTMKAEEQGWRSVFDVVAGRAPDTVSFRSVYERQFDLVFFPSNEAIVARVWLKADDDATIDDAVDACVLYEDMSAGEGTFTTLRGREHFYEEMGWFQEHAPTQPSI